ncbi:MAG: hypothetical protein GC134_04220 [Proteobacteria bacterium]|nr:hypothetical protein [Pseudomonadota bacterium]
MTLKIALGAFALMLSLAQPALAQSIDWNQPSPGDSTTLHRVDPNTDWSTTPNKQPAQPAPNQGSGSGGEHILLQHGGLEGTVPVPVVLALNPVLKAHGLPAMQDWVASGREITNLLRLVTLSQICAITRPAPAMTNTAEGTVHGEACQLVAYSSNKLTGYTSLGHEFTEKVPLPTGASRDHIRAQFINNWADIKYTLSVMLQKERGVYKP